MANTQTSEWIEKASISRGGVTSRYWYGHKDGVRLSGNSGDIEINFNIASKGGGDTHIRVSIPPEHFASVLKMMCVADRQTAMEAMCQELSRQVGRQPSIDSEVEKNARAEMINRANNEYYSVFRHDSNEYFISQAVSRIASEIEQERSAATK